MHLKDCTLVSKETGYHGERPSSLPLVNVRARLRTGAHGAALESDSQDSAFFSGAASLVGVLKQTGGHLAQTLRRRTNDSPE